MPFSNYTLYTEFVGGSAPMAAGTFTIYLDEVTSAIKNHCKNNIEAATYANVLINAPASLQLVLKQKPVQNDGNLTINANPLAYGNVTKFTSQGLLTAGVDYYLNTDDDDASKSTSGVVTCLRQPWSVAVGIPYGWLAPKRIPVPGALLITYRAGYETIPAAVTEATNLAISMLWNRRQTGYQASSESRGSWSVSLGQAATASAIVESPDVATLLRPYVAMERLIGWGVG